MKKWQHTPMIILIAFISAAIVSPLPAKKPVVTSKKIKAETDLYPWFQTLSEVCVSLRKRGFRDINFTNCFEEGLKSLVACADAHSAFFPPKSYKRALESASGEFSGIGISMVGKAPQDDALVIMDVVTGGPAEKAGLKAKDKIVGINNEKLKGLSTDETISKLKGKRGSRVNLKIVRENKPLEFTVKRDIVKDQSSSSFFFPQHNISYLNLKIFSENSAKQMSRLIKKAHKKKHKGMIIDLRRNSGGVLEVAVDIAGLFLKRGSTVVTTKNRAKKVMQTYKTTTDPIFNYSIPIFILMDNFSASASEIFAGCMRHYSNQASFDKKDGPLVLLAGTPSFGKGSVQEMFPISNGCALKITSMLYYLPDDTSIQARGIEPDFLLKPRTIPEKELKWVGELYGKETALKGHITREEVENIENNTEKPQSLADSDDDEVPEKKKEKEKTVRELRLEALAQDSQIRGCINMINLLNLAQKTNPKSLQNRSDTISFIKSHFVTDDMPTVEEVK